MSSKQNNNGNDAQEKSQRALQALKVTITPTRNLQSHTAPTTPTRPTIKQAISSSAIGLSGSVTSNKPSKAEKRANDNHALDLSPWQVPTDPDDMEEEEAQSETPEESRSDIQRKTSTRSFTNLTTTMKQAIIKRSQSARKVSKSPIPAKSPKAAAQGSTRRIGTDNDDKNSLRFKEKPRRSLQPMYQNAEGNESPKQKKKAIKTAVGDLEFDLGIDEKCATEGEEHDNLFPDRSGGKEVHLKELGPVRYSKMSEEDAATVFEMRKRELLAFLIKLGANPNLVKKKFATKNIGVLNQLNNSVEMRSSGFDRERVMRSLKGTLEDNLSPNKFIVYNTDRDPFQRGRFATPSRLKNRAASTKGPGKSEPSFKRRNSAKILRDKEELNVVVKRDLTASFNNVIFDNELSDNKSPLKVRKARDPQLRNSHQIVLDMHDISETKSPAKSKKGGDTTVTNKNLEEKKEVIESFTIDLVKFCSDEKKKKKKKKSKKTKKVKNEDEQILQLDRASQSDTNKLPSENISINTVYESHEDGTAYQKLIETMRQKSKLVMGDINEIDMQIQMMTEDGKKGKSKRGRDQQTKKVEEKPKPIVLEKPKAIFLESLEEGYANVAKAKNAKRSGSFSVNLETYEYTPKTNGQLGGNKRVMNQRENETERLRAGQDTSRTTLSRNNKTEIIAESKNKNSTARIGSPAFEVDRKTKVSGENDNRKKNTQDVADKRALKNEMNAPKTPKQNTSPTNFFGKKETPEITKSKLLSPEKPKPTLDKKSNVIQPQPVTETPQNQQQSDRNKLLNAFRNSSSTTQSQNVPQRFNEETLKRSAAALQQNNKETSNSNFRSGPRPQLLTNEKKMLSSPSSAQIPSTATSNKSPLLTKQNTKKGLAMNKSQLSIDRESCSEINESTDLFDKCQTTKSHKVTKSATKSTFSEGVKKILREGSKEDSLLLGKPPKNQNKTSQPPKPTENSNRPKFEIPAASDIRTKMYKEGRMNHADGTFVKVNYISNGPLELNKPDLRGVVIEEIHNSATTKAMTQSEVRFPEKDGKGNRKRSLSPRPDSNNTTDRRSNQQINSLQDITDKKNRAAGIDIEHAERMKLLGQTVKAKREMSSGNQGQNKPYRQ